MRTSEIRHQIASLESELANVKAKSVTAVADSDEKALVKLERRANEITTRIETFRAAIHIAEAREEEERRQRRVAMTQAAGDALLEAAATQLPAAASELEAAINVLGEKLAKIDEIRTRMMTCASVALEHSRAGIGGVDAAVMNEMGLNALADPFVRALERAGLGVRGIVCDGVLHLAPVGPTVSLADAAQLAIDRIVVRVADLVAHAERNARREPQPQDTRVSRDPNAKPTEV